MWNFDGVLKAYFKEIYIPVIFGAISLPAVYWRVMVSLGPLSPIRLLPGATNKPRWLENKLEEAEQRFISPKANFPEKAEKSPNNCGKVDSRRH